MRIVSEKTLGMNVVSNNLLGEDAAFSIQSVVRSGKKIVVAIHNENGGYTALIEVSEMEANYLKTQLALNLLAMTDE